MSQVDLSDSEDEEGGGAGAAGAVGGGGDADDASGGAAGGGGGGAGGTMGRSRKVRFGYTVECSPNVLRSHNNYEQLLARLVANTNH